MARKTAHALAVIANALPYAFAHEKIRKAHAEFGVHPLDLDQIYK